MKGIRSRPVSLLPLILLLTALGVGAAPPPKTSFPVEVTFSPALGGGPYSGRLLVLISSEEPEQGYLGPGFGDKVRATWIAAREIDGVRPGERVRVSTAEIVFPAPFTELPPGDYWAMAMLDVDHNAAYQFFTAGDLRMRAVRLRRFNPRTATALELTLDQRVPAPRVELPAGMEKAEFTSPLLSRFYGRPITMRALVVLPPGYDSAEKPAVDAVSDNAKRDSLATVYMIPGFGTTPEHLRRDFGDSIRSGLAEGNLPPWVYVVLDESLPTGAHEFADSVNNGPWGRALVEEFIPFLESKYRLAACPGARFLTGHSSGGWSSLWVQVTHPDFFAGTWSTSPDPVDFRHFTGPDIAHVKPGSNFYRKPDGTLWMMVRMRGSEVESVEDYARQERVLGEYGGQMASFEWVFSPRGGDGRPLPLFDRATGAIDLAVAAAWEKYDISRVLRTNWSALGPKLRGKIHIVVGTADSFHLDASVRLLDGELEKLGADAKVTYLPGRTHFDLYRHGLDRQIAREMRESFASQGCPSPQRASPLGTPAPPPAGATPAGIPAVTGR